MAQRGRRARFMGGAWVFPGGVVDAKDGTPPALAALDDPDLDDAPWRAAALRELVEETGVWWSAEPFTVPAEDRPHGAEIYAAAAAAPQRRFAASTLQYFSNWVTPTVVPVRFDARFYVAAASGDLDGSADEREMDAVAWIDPRVALESNDDFILPLPTRHTLRDLAALGTPEAIVDFAAKQDAVSPIQPRLYTSENGNVLAVLPGEPGYDELPDDPPDPEALVGAARVTTLQGESIPELQRRED